MVVNSPGPASERAVALLAGDPVVVLAQPPEHRLHGRRPVDAIDPDTVQPLDPFDRGLGLGAVVAVDCDACVVAGAQVPLEHRDAPPLVALLQVAGDVPAFGPGLGCR